jgi:hypothetical protein
VPELIELELASSSGSLRPDLVTYLIPLFSERIRATLDAAGVDNIDYYPVTLTGPEANQTDDRYMLGNVLGLVECIAHSKSNGTQHPLSKRWQYTSFVIDEERVSTLLLFRPLEMRNLIVVHEHLAERLSAAGLDGVRIRNTRDYDGY